MLKTVALAWCWMSVGALQTSQREELCGALPPGAGERVLSLGFTFAYFPIPPAPGWSYPHPFSQTGIGSHPSPIGIGPNFSEGLTAWPQKLQEDRR